MFIDKRVIVIIFHRAAESADTKHFTLAEIAVG